MKVAAIDRENGTVTFETPLAGAKARLTLNVKSWLDLEGRECPADKAAVCILERHDIGRFIVDLAEPHFFYPQERQRNVGT